MKVYVCLASMLSILVLNASPASAQYIEMYKIDQVAKDMADQRALADAASLLGISSDTLMQQKAEYKISVGELYVVHRMAKASNTDFKSLMTEAKSGKSWGQIALDRKIDKDALTRAARELEEVLKKSRRSGQ